MKKKIVLGLACTLVFVLSAVIHAPASLLRLAPLPPELNVGAIEGTVWKGHIAQIRWQDYTVGPLRWDIQVHRLFTAATLEANIRLRSPDGVKGKATVGFDGHAVSLSHALVSAPADLLASSVALPANVAIEGHVDLVLRDLAFTEAGCQRLDGQLQWQQAALRLPMGRLADIPASATLRCEQQGILAEGQGASSSLSNKFSLSITPSGRYSVSGWLKPEAAFPPPMKEPLAWLGAPDQQGRYRFSFRG